MKQYYLLELILENDEIHGSVLYKTEFTRPYCIIYILLKDIENVNKINFVITDNIDYLIDFVNVKTEEEFEDLCAKFYNKSNVACGVMNYSSVLYTDSSSKKSGEYYSYAPYIVYIDLLSKNFDKYYSYIGPDKLASSNKLVCGIKCIYKANKVCFSVIVTPYYLLSRTRINKEYIKKVADHALSLHEVKEIDIKQFKKFNTFRELVLHCIELDRKYFFSKHKYLSNKEKLIFNEYYDILEDIAKGIEL